MSKLIPENVNYKICCSICENCTFKVERIAPERIFLMCENCGEIHEIIPEIFAHKTLYLKFCTSEMKI